MPAKKRKKSASKVTARPKTMRKPARKTKAAKCDVDSLVSELERWSAQRDLTGAKVQARLARVSRNA